MGPGVHSLQARVKPEGHPLGQYPVSGQKQQVVAEGPPAKISWSELAEHSGSGTTRGSCGQQSIFQASQGSQAAWGRSAHDGSMGKPREGERKVGRASRGKERRGGPWWESCVHTQPRVPGEWGLCSPGFGFFRGAAAGRGGLGSILGEAVCPPHPSFQRCCKGNVPAAHSRGMGAWSYFGLG